jgi:hypothetical protein
MFNSWEINFSEKFEMKNITLWHITPCSPLKVNRRFGGTSSASKNKPSSNQRESRRQASHLLSPEDGDDMFLRNVS